MGWSVKKRVLVSCCVGWGLSIIGAGLIPLLDFVIRKMVEQNVVISPNNDLVYKIWKDYPIPIYMQFYIFHVTNPERVLQGKKPRLKQTGPYTYSEKRFKFNITFNPNGTVTYRQKRVFQFLRDKSVGNESDIFTSPNPMFWTLISALKMESGEVRKVVKDILTLFDEHVFMNRSVKELLWGYQDSLLSASQKIDPEWFYTAIVGYFTNKNDTDDGVYTVYTGERDINLLGVIDKYNGSSVLPFWTTYYANMINGTDGTLSPPYIDKSRTLFSFASDVCRSVAGVYNGDSLTPQGIKVWRFTAPLNYLQNATVNPDNLGFCTPQNNCLGQGLVNISSCQLVDFFHIPAVLSFPHFYLADKKYLDAVVGLNPNEAEHQTIVDAEPILDISLEWVSWHLAT
ncbi:hypothetical protein CHS0354_040311 [Potamilus streckersoni]|uniref:Scavenger receptor class B member 1 n=1 Tax=Potamilus streckersoni TaxID=2493646 RepID=A0AAE0SG09_9BIVA|nr:hypothetical protein CHS0354_040311 [Potamilus streckersoni]